MYEQFGDILNLIILLIILVINIFSIWLIGRGRFISPIFYFVSFFSLQITGTLPLLDLDVEPDQAHACILALASVVILSYMTIFYQRRQTSLLAQQWLTSPERYMTKLQIKKIVIFMTISIIVSVVYYQIVGYNLFLVALKGGADDFTSLRLAAYSGETYTGAGIINQFKNTILPVTFFTLLLYANQIRRQIIFTIIFLALTPIFLYCIAGTGQRSYLFLSLAIVVIYYFNTRRRVNKKLLAVLSGGFVVIFGLFSILLGRQENADFLSIIEQFYRRIFYSQQLGALVGFNYVYGQDIQLGYEWWESLCGLIPGIPGSNLSHRVHALIFGSERGTAPVSLWVSMYHNFGTLGVVISTFILMAILDQTFRFVLRFERNTINDMMSAAIVLYCGLLVFSNPFQIINNGLPGLFILYLEMRPKRLEQYT